jgi:predicted PP-loop superfamily ATPase
MLKLKALEDEAAFLREKVSATAVERVEQLENDLDDTRRLADSFQVRLSDHL